MAEPTSLIEVGYVAKAHGVRGELRIHLHNRDSDTLFEVDEVVLDGAVYAVESARDGSKGAVLLALAGVDDRDAAEALRGRAVCVPRELIPVDDDDVLAVDVIGCEAVLEDGTPWGVVEGIVPGLQDRLVIRDGGVIRELPWVDALVLDIDVDTRRIVVAPPEGLPEEDAG